MNRQLRPVTLAQAGTLHASGHAKKTNHNPPSWHGPVVQPKGRSNEVLHADRTASQTALCRSLDAFPVDTTGARRLSQLRMHVGVAARALAVPEAGKRSFRAWMVTLTYAQPDSWRADHLKAATMGLRKWCNRQGFPAKYVWVAEIQGQRFARTGSAVIHYHAVVWLPQGVRMPKWDVRGWWPHGRTQRVCVRKSAVGYLMKYLSKGTDVTQGAFPKGARIYGCGGLQHDMRRSRRWLGLPSFVQGNSSIFDRWTRRVGGGWLSPSGDHFRSEYECASVGGLRSLLRVARHPRNIDASGPFAWLSDRVKAQESAGRTAVRCTH